ncbi:MAG TPA: hypothetical protein P5092_17235 [Ruminococcus sp.]|nr:hypothetical protein [Ruminococcus sp.]
MATYNGYPFDAEVFNYNWQNENDPTLTAILESGAMQNNSEIARLVANGSDTYTIPFYKTIGGEPENYDGQTDLGTTTPEGDSQSGIVYGRGHGWRAQDFTVDYNSGADPMKQITSQVGKFWNKYRQNKMLDVINAVFGVSAEGWDDHKINASSAEIGDTTVNDAARDALGDAASSLSLAIVHSHTAKKLESLNLVNYRKYTDPAGITRDLPIGDINGKTLIVDDGMPIDYDRTSGTAGVYTVTVGGTVAEGNKFTIDGVEVTMGSGDDTAAEAATAFVTAYGTSHGYSASASGAVITFTEKSGSYGNGMPKFSSAAPALTLTGATTTKGVATKHYTTFLLGAGALQYAKASVKVPSEVSRDPAKNGGEDILYTRVRETIHPNGFSFVKPATGYTASPTNAQLADSNNWVIKGNPKNIAMVKIKTR